MIKKENLFFPVVVMCLSVTALLLIYRISIHSDILFMDYFFQDIFQDLHRWKYWKTSPAPSYFPDMLLYLFAYFTIPTAPLRILFVTLMQIVLLSLSADWLARQIAKNLSGTGRGFVQVFLLLSVIAGLHTTTETIIPLPFQTEIPIGIFFNANNIQVPTLISSLLLLCLYVFYLDKRDWKIVPLLLIVGALAQASSLVFLVNFSAPFCVVLLCIVVWSKVSKNTYLLKNSVYAISIFTFSQCLGYLASQLLTHPGLLQGRIMVTMPRVLHSFKVFWESTHYVFSTDNMYTYSISGIFLVTFLYAYGKIGQMLWSMFYKKECSSNSCSVGMMVACLFLMVSAPMSVLGSILSGGFVDIYGYRYFMTFVAVSAVLSSVLMDKQLNDHNRKLTGLIIGGLCVTLTMYSCWQIYTEQNKRSLFDIAAYGAIPNQPQRISACLEALEKKGVTLHSGIGDFWNAKGVMYYSDNKYYIQQTLNDLTPFYWISSVLSLIYPDKYGIEKYNFVILDKLDHRQFRYSMNTMKDILPKGGHLYSCDDAGADVLVYDGDELDKLLRSKFKHFIASLSPFAH